jgi:phage terminase large subunit-like protein
VSRLQTHFGDEIVVEVPQGFIALSEPSKQFEALIVSGNLKHDGNPCMTWCVVNMAIEENKRWRSIRPMKINQRKRIDGGVAAIDALHKMLRTPYVAMSESQAEWI